MILAFVGAMHSGKTTAAIAVTEYELINKLSFATPLKHAAFKFATETFGLDIPFDQYKNTVAGRKLFQAVGAAGRAVDPDIWVKEFEKQYGGLRNMVIDDCRYLNEAEYIRSKGGVLVRVIRPESDRILSVADAIVRMEGIPYDKAIDIAYEQSTHESETEQAQIEVDFTIEAKAQSTLEKKAVEAYEQLCKQVV